MNLAVRAILRDALDRIIEEVKNGKIDPVVAVRRLHRRRADNEAMFAVLNASYAVVRYGGQIVIASIMRNDVILMKVDDFHKMYANVRVGVGNVFVEVSRLWFKWRAGDSISVAASYSSRVVHSKSPMTCSICGEALGLSPSKVTGRSCEITFSTSSAPGIRRILII